MLSRTCGGGYASDFLVQQQPAGTILPEQGAVLTPESPQADILLSSRGGRWDRTDSSVIRRMKRMCLSGRSA